MRSVQSLFSSATACLLACCYYRHWSTEQVPAGCTVAHAANSTIVVASEYCSSGRAQLIDRRSGHVCAVVDAETMVTKYGALRRWCY